LPTAKNLQHIIDLESQPPPPSLSKTGTDHGPGAPQSEYVSEPLTHDTQGCLETNVHNDPYYPFATHEEYKYILCGNKEKGMMTYYDNVLKEEYTAQHVPNFQNRVCVQKLGAGMPDHQALVEWKLHTLEDTKWNHTHQYHIIFWSQDIIKYTIWLLWQPASTENLV
jgi:hypothetical protein